MQQKEIISSRQFMIIAFLYAIGPSILIIPSYLATHAKQNAWIVAIVGVAISFFIIKLFIVLFQMFPGMNLFQILEKTLGKWLGKLIAIIFIICSFINGSELVFYIGSFMQIEIMPETPNLAFVILFSLIIVISGYLGLETFARAAELFFPLFTLLFTIFFFLILKEVNLTNIQPILVDAKPLPFIASLLYFMSIFTFPSFMLVLLYPNTVNRENSAEKALYIGMGLGGVALTIIIALCIFVLGTINTGTQHYPTYILAQRISIGNFFQRIEVIIAFMWIITIYIRTFVYFYISVIGIQQVFNIRDSKPLIFPLCFILVGITQIIHPSWIHSFTYSTTIWLPYSATFSVGMTLFLLSVAKIRKLGT